MTDGLVKQTGSPPAFEPRRISSVVRPGPLWSVMIPHYSARPDHLETCLRSILQQDPGMELMQIEVIDDGSPQGAPVELVKKIAGERIPVFRCEKNLGLAGVWNRCIERAQGRWVHILHQDDWVLPGFYEKLKAGVDSPAAPGLIYCRHNLVDDAGRRLWLSDADAEQAGCLKNALPFLAGKQRIQTPAVLVRRAAYEEVGGFRADLCFTLDWEMWCRIAGKFPVWFEPEILASYRMHSSATTSRLVRDGRDITDIRRCISIISGYVPDAKTRALVRHQAQRRHALLALHNAEKLFASGEMKAGFRQVIGALKCDCSWKIFAGALRLLPVTIRNKVYRISPST